MRRMVSSFWSPSVRPSSSASSSTEVLATSELAAGLGELLAALSPAFLGQLPERLGQCHGRIGGNGPRSLEILLIHHDRRCPASPVRPVMPVVVAWFRRAAWPRGGHLGGNGRLCESRIRSIGGYLDTVHGIHSRDNVDFGLAQNAKVIARSGHPDQAGGRIRVGHRRPRSERFPPCRGPARRRIIDMQQ